MRKKLRTSLTLLSIVVAFVLFGMLSSIKQALTGGIEIAGADRKRIYVGTENGGLFRSNDGGTTWSPNISSSMLPGHTITRIETHPNFANLLYVTVANFGHAHVFRSRDGGVLARRGGGYSGGV